MLDIEPELDRKLRALYDHIETQYPPASLERDRDAGVALSAVRWSVVSSALPGSPQSLRA